MTRLEPTDLGQYLYRGKLFLGFFRNPDEALVAFEIASQLTDEQVQKAINNIQKAIRRAA